MKDIEKELDELFDGLDEAEAAELSDAFAENALDGAAKKRILVASLSKSGIAAKKRSPFFAGNGFARAASLCACLAVFLIGGLLAGFGIYGNATMGYVTLDVNPSIEIEVSNNKKVKSVNLVNEDAKTVLDGVTLKGEKIENAVTKVLSVYSENHYFDEDAAVLVSFDEKLDLRSAYKESIISAVNKIIGEKTEEALLLVGKFESKNSEVDSYAEENGISRGKASMILEMVDQYTGMKTAGFAETAEGEERKLPDATKSIKELADDFNPGLSSVRIYIGLAKARAIVNADIGTDAKINILKEVFVDGTETPYYHIVVSYAGKEVSYVIDALSGVIIEKTENGSVISKSVSLEKAKEIVRCDIGIGVFPFGMNAEVVCNEAGEECYRITFAYGVFSYDYLIRISDGSVLENGKVLNAGSVISLEDAKEKVSAEFGNGVKIGFSSVSLYDGQDPYYLFKVSYKGEEFAFKLDAVTGAFIERPSLIPGENDYVSPETAQRIIFGELGILQGSGEILRIELMEEAEPYYLIELKFGIFSFRCKIDARSGIITDLEKFASELYISSEEARKTVKADLPDFGAKPEFISEELIAGGIKTPYYRFEVRCGDKLYLYRIDAVLNMILEKRELTEPSGEGITLEEAKKIALESVGAPHDTEFLFAGETEDTTEPYYLISFLTEYPDDGIAVKFTFHISKEDGSIIFYNKEKIEI